MSNLILITFSKDLQSMQMWNVLNGLSDKSTIQLWNCRSLYLKGNFTHAETAVFDSFCRSCKENVWFSLFVWAFIGLETAIVQYTLNYFILIRTHCGHNKFLNICELWNTHVSATMFVWDLPHSCKNWSLTNRNDLFLIPYKDCQIPASAKLVTR